MIFLTEEQKYFIQWKAIHRNYQITLHTDESNLALAYIINESTDLSISLIFLTLIEKNMTVIFSTIRYYN